MVGTEAEANQVVDIEALKRMAADGGTRHMISTPQIAAVIAALEDRERLREVVSAQAILINEQQRRIVALEGRDG